MSDPTHCDVCGIVGRRRMGTLVPEGWSFKEVKGETDDDVFVVAVCSSACIQKFWTLGPGKLDLTDERLPDDLQNT